jgi:hypothetical protein
VRENTEREKEIKETGGKKKVKKERKYRIPKRESQQRRERERGRVVEKKGERQGEVKREKEK